MENPHWGETRHVNLYEAPLCAFIGNICGALILPVSTESCSSGIWWVFVTLRKKSFQAFYSVCPIVKSRFKSFRLVGREVKMLCTREHLNLPKSYLPRGHVSALQNLCAAGKGTGGRDPVCESSPYGVRVPTATHQAALLTPGSTDLGTERVWDLQDEAAATSWL